MDTKQIYKILSYHRLSEDDEQEIAIQLWTKRDLYVASAGTLSTWIAASVKNYLISKGRSKKEREINMQIPLSNFEREDEEGNSVSSIEAYMASDALSPLDNMIASENKEELSNRINELPDIYANALIEYLNGDYNASCNISKTRLSRAISALQNRKQKKEYKLVNLLSNKEFVCSTLTEASTITGMTVEGIRFALKKSGFFLKKTWKISELKNL